MSVMKISQSHADALLKARSAGPKGSSARKRAQLPIMAAIKAQFGLRSTQKLVIFLENPDNPYHLVLRDKRTKMPLDDGKPDVVAVAPVKALVKAVAKAPAKAPVKTVAKAPVKTVAKAPVKTVAKAPAPAIAYPRDLRVTIDGKRVRLGVANDAAHEKRLIAKYKKAHGL